jgi:hypothetical protein
MRPKATAEVRVDHAEMLRRLEREVAKGQRLGDRLAAEIIQRRKIRAA